MKVKAKGTKKVTKAVVSDSSVKMTKATCKKASVKSAATTKKTTRKTHRITFTVRADVGSTVFLAGDFNNWDPTAKEMVDKKKDGLFSATLSLPVGEHQYKFIINGTWCVDPECNEWVQNPHGTLNSIKRVTED